MSRRVDPAERVQELIERLDALGEPARTATHELVSAMLEMYGDGLARILDAVDAAGEEAAAAVRERLVGDGVAASLLLIHGLYPIALEERVRRALDSVRPYLASHGGGVELLGLERGVARLRLEGSCNGCAASASTLELAIEQALAEAAPDLEGLEVEGAVEPAPRREEPALASLGRGRPAWVPLDLGAAGVGPGSLRAVEAGGSAMVVANVGGTLLGYLDACPGCGSGLARGALDGAVLACPACGLRFDLTRAGRAVGDGAGQLRPVPLLEAEGGGVHVAVAG